MSWQIVSTHSQIQFAIRKLGLITVHGAFTRFAGALTLDETEPTRSAVAVQIAAASIDTGIPKRDMHLRSPDFFEAERYPILSFRSTRVEQHDATRGRIVGDLTIRDVTHAVALEVEWTGQTSTPAGARAASFSAHTTISRRDWGVSWGRRLVGDLVTIDIELAVVELVEQAQPAEATLALVTNSAPGLEC
jgi:polyisoprenoid-binding protein YceI